MHGLREDRLVLISASVFSLLEYLFSLMYRKENPPSQRYVVTYVLKSTLITFKVIVGILLWYTVKCEIWQFLSYLFY